jgi:oligo-1,6-glucosidase
VQSAKMLGTVLHLHRGTPYVYQGEELGMANVGFTGVDQLRDIESVNHYRTAVAAGQDPAVVLDAIRRMGRDNARTPMQWDAGPQAGFTTGEPWIEVNPDHVDVNAAAQVDDPGSVFHHYRRLTELRHREPAVVHGDFTMLLPEHPSAYVFTRSYDGVELLVLGNFSGETLHLDLPDGEAWAGAEVVIGNYDAVDDVAELRPWEGRVHRRSA